MPNNTPSRAYRGQGRSEHGTADISLWLNAQEWDRWAPRQLWLLMSEGLPYWFPPRPHYLRFLPTARKGPFPFLHILAGTYLLSFWHMC